MGYSSPEKRRAYVKVYRAKKKALGHYGYCSECNEPLGRNDDAINKSGICIKCNKGEKHQSWKGGYKNSDGYVIVSKGQLQHRVVMEKQLGRKLYEDETIHHLNGVRDDNRIENLELWVGAPTRGIRPQDATAWAKEILRRYG